MRTLHLKNRKIGSNEGFRNMDNNVIVLPGTKWQIPLVKKLKSKGYRVVVLDCYDNQPAYKYADEYYLVDILDKEKVYEIAKHYSALAVISDECDIATPTVSWVSEKLGKPSIGCKLAELYTNKYQMRVFAKEHGLPTPLFEKCYSVTDAIAVFNMFGKKMIMKPLDANSSRGVFSISTVEEIEEYFVESLRYSKAEKCVLLEEYIEGEEFSIDGIMTNKGYYSMAIAHKRHYIGNENLDQELIFKYSDPTFDYDLLRQINKKYVEQTGLEFGLTHAEYKYNSSDGQFYLIEIGARGGGNYISGVINPCLTGIESQELLIDWSLGNSLQDRYLQYLNNYKAKCAILHFFDIGDKTGVIKSMKGVDYLKRNQNIKNFFFSYSIGDKVEAVKDGGNRFGYYIACCNSLEELERIQNEVKNKVSIEFE